MKKLLLLAGLGLATMTLAACGDDDAGSPGPYPTTTNYVEAAPYPDGTQK